MSDHKPADPPATPSSAPAPPALPYTLGELIVEVEGYGQARRTNRAALESAMVTPGVSHSQISLLSQLD
jgi:hypothetical protein